MAIAFRGAGAGTNLSGFPATFTPPVPAGTAADDLLVVVIGITVQQTPATPAGWTLVPVQGGSSNPQNSAGADSRLAVYYKVAVAGQANPTFTWTSGQGAVTGGGIILGYTGVDPASPIDVSAVSAAGAVANTHNPPAVTTLTNGALALTAISFQSGGGVTNFSAIPAGWTARLNGLFASGEIIGIAELAVPVAGLTDPASWTMGGAVSDESAMLTFALKPAGAGGDVYRPNIFGIVG